MDRDTKLEYTKEGFKAVVDAFDFLPEDKREAALRMVIDAVVRI